MISFASDSLVSEKRASPIVGAASSQGIESRNPKGRVERCEGVTTLRRTFVMRAISMVLVAGAAMSLGACATTPPRRPVEVSRFPLGAPLETGTVSAEATSAGWATSLESQVYTGAVATELGRYGYAAPAAGTPSQYLAVVGVTRTTRPGPPRRGPMTKRQGGGATAGGKGGGPWRV